MDGYDMEYAGTCNGVFSYEIKKKITLVESEFTAEFFEAFKPNGFLKVWVR